MKIKIANDLQIFCYGTVSEPWSHGEYTFATNGYLIIRVPRLASVENTNGRPLDKVNPIFDAEPKEWRQLSSYDLGDKIDCDVCDGSGKVKKCVDCKGDGIIYFESFSGIEYEVDCGLCEGSGVISSKEFNAGDEKFKDCEFCYDGGFLCEEEEITIDGVEFHTRTVMPLLKLENCEIGVLGKNMAARFRFKGGDGLVMPIMQD